MSGPSGTVPGRRGRADTRARVASRPEVPGRPAAHQIFSRTSTLTRDDSAPTCGDAGSWTRACLSASTRFCSSTAHFRVQATGQLRNPGCGARGGEHRNIDRDVVAAVGEGHCSNGQHTEPVGPGVVGVLPSDCWPRSRHACQPARSPSRSGSRPKYGITASGSNRTPNAVATATARMAANPRYWPAAMAPHHPAGRRSG